MESMCQGLIKDFVPIETAFNLYIKKHEIFADYVMLTLPNMLYLKTTANKKI